MRVLLVRHGQSEWNASRRLQGQADISLSDYGRYQADTLRPVIESIRPCRTVSSDLERARDTAARIGATQAAYTDQLREIDVGDWTGCAIDALQTEYPEAYVGWRSGLITPPRGESWDLFAARVCHVIDQQRRQPCENLLVVCHGGVIRAILQWYLNLDPANIIPVGPASLSAIRLSSSDYPARLELFNYRPDELDFAAPD